MTRDGDAGDVWAEQARIDAERQAKIAAYVQTVPIIGNRGLEINNGEQLIWAVNRVQQAVRDRFKSPSDAVLAVMHGMSAGLTFTASLAEVMVLDGRAAIFGDSALALVRASGKLESYTQEWGGDKADRFCRVVAVRVGSSPAVQRTIESVFTMDNARAAGLLTKKVWIQFPDRMLMHRARAFALRDLFGDILKGLGIVEELQDTSPKPGRDSAAGADVRARINGDAGSPSLPAPAAPAIVDWGARLSQQAPAPAPQPAAGASEAVASDQATLEPPDSPEPAPARRVRRKPNPDTQTGLLGAKADEVSPLTPEDVHRALADSAGGGA